MYLKNQEIDDNYYYKKMQGTYKKLPGCIFPIFLDLASLGQNVKRGISIYVFFLIFLISFIVNNYSNLNIVLSFALTYLSSLFLIFYASQIEKALLSLKIQREYILFIENLSLNEKSSISLFLINSIEDENFPKKIRTYLFKYLQENNTPNLRNKIFKIDPF